jgi:hypothetical protein
MTSTSVKTVPGLTLPTVQPLIAATPRLSAIQQQQNDNNYQTRLIKSTGGKKQKIKGGAVVVPQFQMSYKPTGGPGQTPNNVITNMSQISTQGKANSSFDDQVYGEGYAKKGGRNTKSKTKTKLRSRTKTRKGGNRDWKWGCYSGGYRKIRKSNKSKKSKK